MWIQRESSGIVMKAWEGERVKGGREFKHDCPEGWVCPLQLDKFNYNLISLSLCAFIGKWRHLSGARYFFSIFTLPSIHHHQHTFKPNVFFVAFFFFNEFLLLSFPTRKCQAPIMLSCTWIKFFRHEDNCTHTSTLGSNPELDPMH